jgi:predicted phage baseplate assembly protein
MPISPPRLDDRSFDDLVGELVARIPAHTPEWTHPAPGDPGRTLLELFAWLADTILYRANLVPERQRLVFLKLLGVPLRPALPARGIVALEFEGDDLRPGVTLRAGGCR